MNTPGSESAPFRIAPHVLAASAYVPEWLDMDRSSFIRLDRNENTQPLPAAVRAALAASIENYAVQSYPDYHPLQRRLSGYVGVPAECILPTNGSDQGIDLCMRLTVGVGDSALVARPEFSVFSHVADVLGARVVGVPYGPDFSFPYEQFTAEIAATRPDLIILINPNNPTGTEIDTAYVEEVVSSNPDTPVIVDEAYYEYTGRTVAPFVMKYRNMMVLRTFSKAFAMAGLRLGYVAATADVITQLRKLQNPFDVNQLALAAGMAQLGRIDSVLADARHATEVVKPHVVKSLRDLGIEVLPGAANFVLVRPPGDCSAAVGSLRGSGVLVRPMTVPRLRGYFRASLGTMDEMHKFVAVFTSYVESRTDDARPGERER
jgi:histidinol-phosphate aminotransferase